MLIERSKIDEKLEISLNNLKTNNIVMKKLKNDLMKNHKVFPGKIQQIINKDIEVKDLDLSLVCLLTKKIYELTEDGTMNPNNYFTEKEIRIAQRYEDDYVEEQQLNYPLRFENVIQLSSEDYILSLSVQDIVKLFNNGLIEYNFETQRDPRYARRKDKIVKVPKLNRKSVREIREHLLNQTYLTDTITLNLLADGNDDMVYDAKTKSLIINDGEINILDGFHRLKAIIEAYEKDPELEFTFQVAFKNYSLRKAQAYVAQVNTQNKIDKAHLQSLKAERYADFIVKELMRESDLKNKVVAKSMITTRTGGLTTYNTLADAIDDVFEINNKKEAMDVVSYLIKFFDYLIGSYPDAFINKIEDIKEYSLINNSNMFYGYVVLAKKFYNVNAPVDYVTNIIEKIDFNKNNPLWQQIGVLDKEGRIMKNAKKSIKKYFSENINLETGFETGGVKTHV